MDLRQEITTTGKIDCLNAFRMAKRILTINDGEAGAKPLDMPELISGVEKWITDNLTGRR